LNGVGCKCNVCLLGPIYIFSRTRIIKDEHAILKFRKEKKRDDIQRIQIKNKIIKKSLIDKLKLEGGESR
jgi:hypothetical protein